MCDARRLVRLVVSFAALCAAYQLPEGIGQRLLGSFPIQATLLLLFFVVAYVVGRMWATSALEAYGLDRVSRAAVPLLLLFVLAIAAKGAAAVIGVSIGVYQRTGAAQPGMAGALAAGLLMTFAPSIAEDIVTRGFWFRAARVDWRPAIYVLATSAIYVLNHVFRLGLGPGEWLMLFSFGVAYGLAVVRFGSLWPAVGLHWGWNYGNVVVNAVWPVESASVSGARMLSIGAHLAIAALLVWLTRRREGTGVA